MAHVRRSSFPRTRGSSQKRFEWGDGPQNPNQQSAAAAGTTLIGSGQESLQNQTIVRIRGELLLFLETVTTIGDGFISVHAGIGVTSVDAFNIGVTALPTPSGDSDWPGWIWYHAGASLIGQSVTESENTGTLSQMRIPIDTKAMRKWRLNEAVFGVVELGTEVGTAVAQIFMSTRLLSKVV